MYSLRFKRYEFGQDVKIHRERCGESLRDHAKRIGVSASTLSRWERGFANPTVETFVQWCNETGETHVKYITKHIGEMEVPENQVSIFELMEQHNGQK